MTNFTFRKLTNSHADILAAIGAASLLHELNIEEFNPVIIDSANHIEVQLSQQIESADFEDIGPGFKYLLAPKDRDEADGGPAKAANKIEKAPQAIPRSYVFDYTAEDEKYRRQQAAKASKDLSIREAIQEDTPDPDFRIYRLIKTLQAQSGLNKFVEQFFGLAPDERKTEITQNIGSDGTFFFESPLVQLFNPQAAKGYALLKPNGTGRNDKTKEKWAEPFVEWLRYRGFFVACAGWFLGSKGEHVRIYCPIPGKISFNLYRLVVSKFRDEPLAGSGSKIDCLGTLRLTRILIERSETLSPPTRFISGIWVTHYQSLGRVKAVTSIDRIATPNWFDLASPEDAQLWLETLAEHDIVLRRLSDDVSEELALLNQYRRFLQANDQDSILELIDFFGSYGSHIFRLRGQDKWLLPQFTRQKVEAILHPSYKQILEDSGFRSVADALRAATVSAQVAKRHKQDYRTIQYGIFPNLRREIATGRESFIRAISDFITTFNAESARRYEHEKSGFRVSQDELSSFVQLLDNDNWETVAALLCALATCKIGKGEKEDQPE